MRLSDSPRDAPPGIGVGKRVSHARKFSLTTTLLNRYSRFLAARRDAPALQHPVSPATYVCLHAGHRGGPENCGPTGYYRPQRQQ